MDRRLFLKLGCTAAGISVLQPTKKSIAFAQSSSKLPFKISLAQWSLNKGFFGRVEPKLDPLDFAKIANSLDIHGLEYVNQFFMDKAQDMNYLKELKNRADDNGCRSVLIMCDNEGNLGNPEETERIKAVENHYKWLEAAKFLGCHSIRVNAHSKGTFEEQQKLVTDGLGRLCEKGEEFSLNVIVENHGGYSSNPDWLVGVIKAVNKSNVGTLPDFGNFGENDPYRGVEMMMPYAKGVSAKASFDENGKCRTIDYYRVMRIVKDAGWDGYVGIESGSSKGVSEMEAIKLTKKLLEDVGEKWLNGTL